MSDFSNLNFNTNYLNGYTPPMSFGTLPTLQLTPFKNITPADLGTGLFNMPVMPFGGMTDTFSSRQKDYSNLITMAFEQQKTQMNDMFAKAKLALLNAIANNKKNNENAADSESTGTTSSTSTTAAPGDMAGGGNTGFNVTKKYTGTAEELDKNLKGVLAGKGAKLMELQEKYGINAAFLAALVNTESAHGSSSAARTKNNVAGIMSSSSNFMKLAAFDSVDDCLEALARNLSKNYVGKGLVTISQIHGKYCPIGAANDPTGLNKNWSSTISQLTDKYQMA